jgi:hypothetical protein
MASRSAAAAFVARLQTLLPQLRDVALVNEQRGWPGPALTKG